MTSKETFLTPEAHFERLVERMAGDELALYRSTAHVRTEDAFRGRTFYIYRIVDRAPEILDKLTVQDFVCNDSAGSSTEIRNENGETITVGYEPIRAFDYPIFLYLPLHCRVRWSTVSDRIDGGSLAFPILVRTMSRLHLRERGVIYMETGVTFSKEFESKKN